MFAGKPNANGSQFLITLREYKEGTGRFVVFGTVIRGQELLRTVGKGLFRASWIYLSLLGYKGCVYEVYYFSVALA